MPAGWKTRENTEKKMTMALCRNVFPLAPEHQLEMWCECRTTRSKDCEDAWSGLLTDENLAIMQGTLEEMDAKDFEAEVRKSRPTPVARTMSAPPPPPAQPSSQQPPLPPPALPPAAASSSSDAAAASSSSDARVRMPTLGISEGHITIEEARLHMPVARGCTLGLQQFWHCRWRAFYPKRDALDVHGGWCNKSFGGTTSVSSEQALSYVLKTVWAWHEFKTGEACPHSL